MEPIDLILRAGQLLTMPEAAPGPVETSGGGALERRDRDVVGWIEDGCLLVRNGVIVWVGPWADRPRGAEEAAAHRVDTPLATPGWVDCHTHAVFAGERANEFSLRNAGRPYVEILEAGGGILHTVDAVRAASFEALCDSLRDRAERFLRRGVTTLEVKSGYGLSVDDEIKCLRAVSHVNQEVPIELVPCFLGAHAIPRDYRERRSEYLDLVCQELIPRVAAAGLAGYCDVFCDRGAFAVHEARRVLETGMEHGMTPRIHADELSNAGAAQLACEIGAASADHLEWTPKEVLEEMARLDVVGVLMPAVNLFLRTTDHLPDARTLLEAGGEVALSTDYNPGSAMTMDIALMTTLGCTLYGLTPGEALRGVTISGAKALRRPDIGRLCVQARADVVCFDVSDYRTIPYHMGENHVTEVYCRGELAYRAFDDQGMRKGGVEPPRP